MHRVNAHRHLHIRLEPAGIPLVRNIGFGADATHTKEPDAYSSVGAEELDLPLTHPATLQASSDKDELEPRLRPNPLNEYAFALKSLLRRAPVGR